MTDLDDPDLKRAVDCPVCRAAGRPNLPPPVPPPKSAEGRRRGLRRLTSFQAAVLCRVWDYLASARPGGQPDERLLALVCLLRAVRSGRANLTSQDVRGLRAGDPHAAVAALTGSGWLDSTTPEAVLSAEPMTPAVCLVPEFADNPWDIGEKARTRASGWTSGMLAHKLLRKKSNAVRLTAVYLTSHADPEGAVDFRAEHLMAACALDGVDTLVSCLGELVDAGWLGGVPAVNPDAVSGHLGEAVASLAPQPPPPEPERSSQAEAPAGAEDTAAPWPELDSAPTVADRAQILIAGREAQVAAWVRAYRDEHGHGPKWADVAAAQGWPPHKHRHKGATETAFVLLAEQGWLEGLGRPYALRPGAKGGTGSSSFQKF
jgi:hypothetical protein